MSLLSLSSMGATENSCLETSVRSLILNFHSLQFLFIFNSWACSNLFENCIQFLYRTFEYARILHVSLCDLSSTISFRCNTSYCWLNLLSWALCGTCTIRQLAACGKVTPSVFTIAAGSKCVPLKHCRQFMDLCPSVLGSLHSSKIENIQLNIWKQFPEWQCSSLFC